MHKKEDCRLQSSNHELQSGYRKDLAHSLIVIRLLISPISSKIDFKSIVMLIDVITSLNSRGKVGGST